MSNNLINILESYLDGDLDALVNSSIPDPPFSRIAPLNRIKLILMLLIRIFSPVVLVWLFIHTPFSPEAPIDDYLKVGAFALSGLMFMTEIDPNFGEKISSLPILQDFFQKLINRNDK